MKTNKLERLQADGWKVGSAEDFLQLSDEEVRIAALMYGDLQGDCWVRIVSLGR